MWYSVSVCVQTRENSRTGSLFIFHPRLHEAREAVMAVIIVNERSGTGKQWHLLPGDE